MATTSLVLRIFILAMVALQFANSRCLADEKDRLVGTWKLVLAVSEELATGEKANLYNGTPTGYITYGADGRMMTVIVDSGRKKPEADVATSSEAEALFRSLAAYAGTYTIMGNQVVHHVDVSWNQSWTGTDQVRNYKFDGERLTIATAPSPSPRTGKISVRTLVWEKVR